MRMPDKGLLIVVSGPSGSGKGTVLKQLFTVCKRLYFSVSATTREARPGEQDGTHYFFLTRQEFENQIADSSMLEYAEYCGNYYGTPRSAVEEKRCDGIDVVLDIEIKGTMQIKHSVKDAVFIFLMPPSIEELEKRLRGRGTETEEKIQKRLATAKVELGSAYLYDYVVVNDDIVKAAEEIGCIIKAEKLKTKRMKSYDYTVSF